MLNTEFYIGNFLIKDKGAPYVVAEAGSNHNQSFDRAVALIEAAAEAGADAVKFQLFSAEKLYPEKNKHYELFKSIELDRDWIPRLVEHARKRSLHFMASAFDADSVDLLDDSQVSAFKIASSECTNHRLLDHTARKGRPLILSTGMCDMVDVCEAVRTILQSGNRQVALLQCSSVYPVPNEQAHIRVMDTYRHLFGCPTGFSDHTLGTVAAVVAVGRGASVVEKHFTLNKQDEGPDHFYALEPRELADYVRMLHEAHAAIGSGQKELLPEERMGRREGIYTARRIEKGGRITADDVHVRRPAEGIRSRYRDLVVGSRAQAVMNKDEPITWDKIRL
jgi:sialic acid synthase SpsE